MQMTPLFFHKSSGSLPPTRAVPHILIQYVTIPARAHLCCVLDVSSTQLLTDIVSRAPSIGVNWKEEDKIVIKNVRQAVDTDPDMTSSYPEGETPLYSYK